MVADVAQRPTTRVTTKVMSCAATIVVTGDSPRLDDLAEHAVARLDQLEQLWSRFLPTSEISALNDAGGEPRIVSADTVRLVQSLIRAWHATDGAFDPTLLASLVGLGYAASRDDPTRLTSLPAPVMPRGCPGDVMIDPDSGWIQLPTGTALDPGGLGKGLAADIVVEELIDGGAHGALVEVGGDLRVSGTPPASDAWNVAIAPTFGVDAPRSVRLQDGGIATSTSRLRTWTHGHELHHHLIDPHTLRSSDTKVVSCTVIAGSAAWAEAFTKLPFAEAPESSLDRLDARQLPATIVTTDGLRHDSAAWEAFRT